LFGTVAKVQPGEPLRYGVLHQSPTYNPVRLALREWPGMMSTFRSAKSLPARARALIGPPGG
jgi:hypothetical protein